jgi:aminoglycoside 3-N-acetyltransferase
MNGAFMDVNLSRQQITDCLTRLGVNKGDHLIVHSALASFGRIDGGAKTLIKALLDAVGPQGTIVMPAFGCADKVFDPEKSETGLGEVPRAFWKMPGARRSRHPLASVAAVGAKADWLVEGHENAELAHGESTPYTKLAQIGGKILLLGVDQDRNTFLHGIEEHLRLSYLKTRPASYLSQTGQTITKEYPFFPGPHRNFIGLGSWLESQGLVKKTLIGTCVTQLMPMRQMMDALLEHLKADPALFISENPNLPDGVSQRADLLKNRLRQEKFTLAADSQYAGSNIEEICGNLTRFGISNIVLSYINDNPWHTFTSESRAWYLKGLELSGIKVAALKLPLLPDNFSEVLDQAGTDKLILPSTLKPDQLKNISKYAIYFENILTPAKDVINLIETANASGISAKLAFNPLEFARVCQNPFLTIYAKTSAKRHTDILFINDGLPSGQRTLLEEGLAEIKELISIFRCRSFDGLFVLQGTDSRSFARSAEKFMSILKELGDVPTDN